MTTLGWISFVLIVIGIAAITYCNWGPQRSGEAAMNEALCSVFSFIPILIGLILGLIWIIYHIFN